MVSGARKMVQWLRALSAFLKDLGSVPSTYMTAGNGL